MNMQQKKRSSIEKLQLSHRLIMCNGKKGCQNKPQGMRSANPQNPQK